MWIILLLFNEMKNVKLIRDKENSSNIYKEM